MKSFSAWMSRRICDEQQIKRQTRYRYSTLRYIISFLWAVNDQSSCLAPIIFFLSFVPSSSAIRFCVWKRERDFLKTLNLFLKTAPIAWLLYWNAMRLNGLLLLFRIYNWFSYYLFFSSGKKEDMHIFFPDYIVQENQLHTHRKL